MRKAFLVIFALVSFLGSRAQQVPVEFDITKIERFDQRIHILYTLGLDERFGVALGGNDGVFIIDYGNDEADFSIEEAFSDFLKEENVIFNSMSKEELGSSYPKWKSSLPDSFVNNIMMDIYVKSRQNNMCIDADPFCTDNGLYQFPAGVNAGSGEQGPNYNCLSTTPNPAWYYMRMANPGGMSIYMYSTPEKDIDFCCWGPFDDPKTPCPNGLTANKVVSCSYSSNPTETCVIPSNATTGQYYILVITNFSNSQCNITFSKTDGSGTTDCSILEPFLTANTPCYGSSLVLQADEINDATYTWTSPDNQTHSGRIWSRSNATLNMAGIYTCNVVSGTQSGNEVVNVVVLPNVNADFNFSNALVGQPVQFTGAETTTPSGNNSMITERLWNFGDGSTSTSANPTHTYNSSGTYTVTYTVKAQGGNDGECSDVKTKTVTVTDQFSTTATASNSSLCEDESTTLTATASGGYGNYTYSWAPAQYVDYPNAATTTAHPPVGGTDFTCTVSDGNANQTPSVTITVHAKPEADAGDDVHVNFNGTTTLSAAEVPGAAYAWAPADKINGNANQQTVTTKPLQEMVTFTLTVTTQHGCTDTDNVTVTVGNQLQGNVTITGPSSICEGEATTLKANPAGGTGTYSYSWAPAQYCDNPTEQVTTVHPTLNVNQFTCTVDDGESTVNMQTTINVNHQPEAVMSSNHVSILAGNHVILTAQAVNDATCSWEPADLISDIIDPWTARSINLPENVNTHFTLTVTTSSGCASQDEIYVSVYRSLEGSAITTSNASVCDGHHVTLTAHPDGGTGDFSYHWTPEAYFENPHAQTTRVLPTLSQHSFTCTITDNGIDDPDNNKIDKTIDIEVLERPSINSYLIGRSLVEPGIGIIPYIYEYNVDVLNLHGYGIDDPSTEFEWRISTYGDVPNHVPGSVGESTWTILESTRYTAYVMVNAEGYALLRCNITTSCGTTHTDKFIYTDEAYLEYFSTDEINYEDFITVYPNPSDGEINISYGGILMGEPVLISIYSYNGVLVDRFEDNSTGGMTHHSMSDYANGLYFINITGKEFTVTKKILLNR